MAYSSAWHHSSWRVGVKIGSEIPASILPFIFRARVQYQNPYVGDPGLFSGLRRAERLLVIRNAQSQSYAHVRHHPFFLLWYNICPITGEGLPPLALSRFGVEKSYGHSVRGQSRVLICCFCSYCSYSAARSMSFCHTESAISKCAKYSEC